MPCASWRGQARSGAVVLVSTFLWPRVLDHRRGVYGEREGKGACLGACWCLGDPRGERRGSGEAWSHGNAGASSAASSMADRSWTRPWWLYHGSSLVGAGASSGGGVVGVLQTRWGDEGWPLAGRPRRGGKTGTRRCSPLMQRLELGDTTLGAVVLGM